MNVKLRSLDGELDRNIFFSSKLGLYSVDVGRASKNLERNMYQQRGNAWIESPVMSRQHAQIFVEDGYEQVRVAWTTHTGSEAYKAQAVYIKDMGSTHGTKLNDHLIAPRRKIRIVTSDVLGFGGTVMAGTQTFKAKTFQVECQWERIR